VLEQRPAALASENDASHGDAADATAKAASPSTGSAHASGG
jgi:hypothetical protein